MDPLSVCDGPDIRWASGWRPPVGSCSVPWSIRRNLCVRAVGPLADLLATARRPGCGGCGRTPDRRHRDRSGDRPSLPEELAASRLGGAQAEGPAGGRNGGRVVGGQLDRLRLGRLGRAGGPDEPRLLHQSAVERGPRSGGAGGATPPAPVDRGRTGDHRGGRVDDRSRFASVGVARPRRHLCALRPAPQGLTRGIPRRPQPRGRIPGAVRAGGDPVPGCR